MKIIGLTGGIASGKSTVSKMLVSLNIPVLDCDYIVKNIVYKDRNILKQIEETFGLEVFKDETSIHYEKLGKIVFGNEEKIDILNKITHPAIKKVVREKIKILTENGEVICVIDDPLLIESKYSENIKIVDEIILIYVNPEIQLARLMLRNNLSKEAALIRISAQMTFEEKKIYSDYIVDNNGSVEETHKQVLEILNTITRT